MQNEHPSKDIKSSKGNDLNGKSICVCLTGSVAVVNTPSLCRELMRVGAEVYVVMSKAATELIQPDLLKWSTGNDVITKLTGDIEHVYLAGARQGKRGKADLILIAPATANTISKIACGIDDTPVTTIATTAFGSQTPIVIVPAMHQSMYQHPIVEDNIKKLKEYGVDILLPRVVENKAKIADNNEIISFIINKLSLKQDLKGLNFLITAGPAREYIDSVRFITNPSSGHMGIEITKEITARGGKCTLVYGPGNVIPPASIQVLNVTSADDFLKKITTQLDNNTYECFISAAAISDFTPKEGKIEGKINSSKGNLILELKPTPKIIDAVRKKNKEIILVAFKAQTDELGDELIDKAFTRLVSAKADLIVANNVSSKNGGFQSEINEVYIIDKDKNYEFISLTSKREIAAKLIDHILKALKLN